MSRRCAGNIPRRLTRTPKSLPKDRLLEEEEELLVKAAQPEEGFRTHQEKTAADRVALPRIAAEGGRHAPEPAPSLPR